MHLLMCGCFEMTDVAYLFTSSTLPPYGLLGHVLQIAVAVKPKRWFKEIKPSPVITLRS